MLQGTAVIQLLCIFMQLIPPGWTTLLKQIRTTEILPVKSSITAKSIIECLSWAQTDQELYNGISYDSETEACGIYKLNPHNVYKAVSQSDENGYVYHMKADCIPTYCGLTDSFKSDPTAFLSDLYYYAPLAAKDGASLTLEYYTTPSLTKHTGSSLPLWDKTFHDGNYPIYTSDTFTTETYFALPSPKALSSMSAFAWAYFDSSLDQPVRPVLGVHQVTNFKGGFILGAGHPSYVDRLSLMLTDSNDVPHVIMSDNPVIKQGVWQHIGATYDAATGESHLYYNGVSIKSANLGSGIQTHTLQWILVNIGYSIDGLTQTFPLIACQGCATIHHEVYERALTFSEVESLYQKINCVFPEDYCSMY